MDLQTISNSDLVNKYGTSTDGIFVYNGNSKVGYLTDLRISTAKSESKRLKQKEYTNQINELRAERMPEAVQEMCMFLESYLTKFGANVFINISQPNIHLNGVKYYVIVDPIYGKHSLGVLHPTLTFGDMAIIIDKNASPSQSNNHILFRSLDQDEIINVVLKLCQNH